MSKIRDWEELRRETVADYGVFGVERSRSRSPEDGAEYTFHRILSADWAQIVPVTPAGEIVMIRQYRHGAGRITLEIPGGLIDPGEDAAVAAARELIEETGYRAATVRALGAVNPNPALFSNRLHTFVGEGAERVAEISNHGSEYTDVELVPSADVPRLLVEGAIEHALVAQTLWRYLHDLASTGAKPASVR